jgi:hypothetical protein
VTRGLAATIGLLAGLAPALAHAQTNIDQGKTPAQIFAADCAECHKAARALASGKNSITLTEFLREHYTTSRDQAAALAAYVLSGRGGESGAASAQARGQKPALAHAAAPAEEPKPRHQTRQSPEEAAPASAKLQPQRPATATRGRRKEPGAPPPEEPSAAVHPPAVAEPASPGETPSHETNPASAAAAPVYSAPANAAPADAASGENAPVPRDDIPD